MGFAEATGWASDGTTGLDVAGAGRWVCAVNDAVIHRASVSEQPIMERRIFFMLNTEEGVLRVPRATDIVVTTCRAY